MKIVIVQGAFFPVPPLQGGAVEKIWYRLGHEFATFGHCVIHISKRHPQLANKEFKSGVNYIRVSGYEAPSSLLKLKTLDLLYTFRAIREIPIDSDIIVTNTFWAPILIKSKLKKKVYISVERVPKGQMRFYGKVAAYRGCSLSICKSITEELPMALEELITYVPNPVPFTIRKELLKKEKQKVILFVGRIHPEKGIDVLINAFKKLPESVKKVWKLNIVGPFLEKEGGAGPRYLNHLKKNIKNENIEFSGPIFIENSLAELYALSSIFVYPAQEGSGDAAPVSPREAMAYGSVPIVSELACFNDFIVNDENGVYFNHKSKNQESELASKILSLIENQRLLETLKSEALKIGDTFSINAIAKRFINDFTRINKKE